MLQDVKVTTGLDYVSGSADRNGAILDMSGYRGVYIIVKFGAIATGAVTKVKAQQGAVANMSDAADLEGSGMSVAADDDNQVFILDVDRPRERYVRGVIDKDAVNATAEVMLYLQYGPDYKPQVNDVTDAVTTKTVTFPAEGTA